jgi:site-specific DNA-cytosine methylase
MELFGPVNLIILGWECQGFSTVGFGEGLSDTRSGLFTDMIRLITWAQSISPTLRYVIKNSPSQFDQREKIQEHYTLVKHYLGEPLLLDAAQCGSYAHRLRNWWTNLAPLLVLQLALRYTIRDPNLQVSHILDDQNSCQPVTRQEKPLWFPANTIGKPRGAWPTFVSFPGAHAFQRDGPGLVYRHASTAWDEPSPKERKRAMGFQAGTTSHTKVIRLECNALLGRGMDLNSLTWLLVTYVLFQMYTTPTLIQSAYSSNNAITWHPN